MPNINNISNSVYHINFNKLFRKNVGYKTYKTLIEQSDRAIVGNIPNEIIKLFDKTQRAKKIKQFQNAIADVAQYMCNSKNTLSYSSSTAERVFEKYQQIKSEEATSLLNKKLKDIIPNIRAKIKFADYGAYKDVYKFSLIDNNGKKIMHDKALAIFYNSEYLRRITLHGLYAESNLWTFLKYRLGHSLDKTQYTKHFMSDMKNKYMITEFADENISKSTKPFSLYKLFGMIYTDEICNPKIYGKIYDIGGVNRTERFIDDKVVFKFYKKIFNRNTEKERNKLIENLKKLVQNRKTPHRKKIQKAIELYKINSFYKNK